MADPTLELPTVESVDALPPEALAAAALALAALQGRIAARMAAVGTLASNGTAADRLLIVEEAAELLHVTPDWLRRQRTLPFRVEISPGQVRYSAEGLQRFIRSRAQR